MKGTQLGEFEELVLLIVAVLYPEAYGLNIRKQMIEETNRKVAIGAVHSSLNRLEKKGFIQSELAEGTHVRGGRRKRLFQITASGRNALEINRSLRNNLWNRIPQVTWENVKYIGL